MTEQRKPLGYFIGHVKDHEHRYKASSGGIGTMLQKYLLSTGQYGTSITFQFNTEKCMYEAQLIHSAEDVNVCGSIYQDINIAQFVHNHIEEITKRIVVSCPPCQVAVIRNLLNRKNIPCFIISFCCSGQTTIEGTWKYYELLGIKKTCSIAGIVGQVASRYGSKMGQRFITTTTRTLGRQYILLGSTAPKDVFSAHLTQAILQIYHWQIHGLKNISDMTKKVTHYLL